jgi:hypothetical protein
MTPRGASYLRYRQNQSATAVSTSFASAVCGAGSMPGSAAKACPILGMLVSPTRSGSLYR